MLAVVTGPVRSGKSGLALRLALESGRPVVVAVAGDDSDDEMRRRIARHRAERPEGVRVVDARQPDWRERITPEECLLLDCLGTVLGEQLWPLVPAESELADPEAEEQAEAIATELVAWLASREAHTVVVSNEVGWGIVPATPLGRLFRDVVGRANRALVEAAEAAWLVVAGRCIDLKTYPEEVSWRK
jgi:adenosylcobinamide kinase/adenosylcobinamide-phosphate guanylyltransferase